MKGINEGPSDPPRGMNGLKPERFLVGQNSANQWVARDEHGRRGGIFTSQPDALHFARREVGDAPCAIVLVAEPLSLFAELRSGAVAYDEADAQRSAARR